MALLHILKKKKSGEREYKQQKKVEKTKTEKPAQIPVPKVKEKRIGEAWRVLKSSHITEKTTDLIKQNQYVFKVWPKANKTEIKRAVENLYGVNAMSVKIIRVPKKKRRLGKIKGWRKGYKKAIVKLKGGQKIEVMPK